MATLKDVKRIVIKVGTSSLTHSTGKTNIRQIKKLVTVISDIVNSGVEVALVSSGAIAVGVGKIGLKERPVTTAGKQAVATVGQCELMFMYDKMFGEYGHTVGQFLITKRDVDNIESRENLINAFEKTFEFGSIPIINENDVVGVEEIVYGDNDNLSAIVAKLIHADALLILTDIDGLYDGDPNKDEYARIIPVVEEITEGLFEIAGGKGSKFGTGGMITKLQAAQIATEAGIDTVVMNGGEPENIYKIIEGHQVGTFFVAKDIKQSR
ncbi:glutamate 5-kinase [uncultured Eubacterium sp.]|uniref:glutamate 5-kinase n=1 Tax=uncultured Eubacterium sp. TaxID=165185 RepID=UPI0026713C8B|nr:glutamate 5-kinase [uncultured Eubacterium sp.]